jgi:hypothetical protein
MTLESTDLMLHLVAGNRGVSVLPDWLVKESAAGMPVVTLALAQTGCTRASMSACADQTLKPIIFRVSLMWLDVLTLKNSGPP